MMTEPVEPKTPVAALFAAPDDGEHIMEAVAASDPLAQLSEEEIQLARFRAMRVDDLVMEFIGARDYLDDERHKWQKLEKDLKDKMATMSMVMREKADSLGVDAFPIRGVGTAYRNTKVSYRIGNWEFFSKWVLETGNTQCLEKRVAKLATVEVERALGATPPGVDKVIEVEFLVRRNQG